MNENTTINITRKEQPELFEAIAWLNLATNRDDSRAMCHCLHVNEFGDMVTTDGHRMHRVSGVGHTLGKGSYLITRRGPYGLKLESFEAPLPQDGWDRTDSGAAKGELVTDWEPPTEAEQVPHTLYRLISQVGILEGRHNKVGFNPWYLADALEQANDVLRASPDGLYLATGAGVEGPQYQALVMGFRL